MNVAHAAQVTTVLTKELYCLINCAVLGTSVTWAPQNPPLLTKYMAICVQLVTTALQALHPQYPVLLVLINQMKV